ncbi:hypothetical protein ACFYUV_38295 [Nonomuraea sp. NPDC003560]|uniref:hypothetical protein n=1 Tax=Nonomuraea sp. NPDC003560 TaxID=3364341 RepID=UPI00369823F0
MYVRFTPVDARKSLPIGHAAVSEHIGDQSLWKISSTDIDLRDPQIIERLDDVGTAASKLLAPLPQATPRHAWGALSFEEYDIEVRDIDWTLTEAGILIRVPRGLLRARLRAEIEVIATDQMRYFDPPDSAIWRKIIAERKAREGY